MSTEEAEEPEKSNSAFHASAKQQEIQQLKAQSEHLRQQLEQQQKLEQQVYNRLQKKLQLKQPEEQHLSEGLQEKVHQQQPERQQLESQVEHLKQQLEQQQQLYQELSERLQKKLQLQQQEQQEVQEFQPNNTTAATVPQQHSSAAHLSNDLVTRSPGDGGFAPKPPGATGNTTSSSYNPVTSATMAGHSGKETARVSAGTGGVPSLGSSLSGLLDAGSLASAASHDTTGGMAMKIQEAAAIAVMGIPVIVAEAGSAAGAAACLHGPEGVKELPCTIVTCEMLGDV
jgi:hypothetical protein